MKNSEENFSNEIETLKKKLNRNFENESKGFTLWFYSVKCSKSY